MAHHPRDRNLALAGLGELWPVFGYRLVVVEQPVVDQDRGAHGRGAFGGGEHQLQSAFIVGPAALGVCGASGDVDHGLATHIEAEPSTNIAVLRKVGPEGIGDLAVSIVDSAIHVHVAPSGIVASQSCHSGPDDV